jgi:hypothetical protein
MASVAVFEQRMGVMRQEMGRVRNYLESWMTTQQRAAETAQEQHRRFIAASKDTVETLKAEHAKLVEKTQQLQQTLAAERAEAEAAEAAVQRSKTENEQLRKLMSQEQAAVEMRMKQFKERTEKVAAAEKEMNFQRENLRSGLAFYEKYMGITVTSPPLTEGTGKAIQIKFTKIDARDAKKEFKCIFLVTEDGTYKLHSTAPYLPTAQQLVTDLNRTNNLGAFVRVLRKEFQHFASSSIGGK